MAGVLDAFRKGETIREPVALVLAHPDDETIGLGGNLIRFARLRLIYLTDGSPIDLGDAAKAGFGDRESYAAARKAELDVALGVLGASGAERIHYDYVDQRSIEHLGELADRLGADLRGVSAVITHPYEHGHPDHDTAALAVQLAARGIERLEFASYHLAHGQRAMGRFWPDKDRPEVTLQLEGDDLARKQAATACFRTQARVLAEFDPAIERVRAAADYDFTRPALPAAGLYDSYGWAITSRKWREQAGSVMQAVPARCDA